MWSFFRRQHAGRWLAVGALCTGSCSAPAQSEAPAPRPPPGCDAAEYRQFDFWLGEWEVSTPDGQVAGHNTITRVAGGCALHENWVGRRGFSGQSLNGWNRRTRQWQQTWIDSSGGRLDLAGGADGGGMLLEGRTPHAQESGRVVLHRIRWSPLPDGRVRQHWETSADDGRNWSTAFDGSYRRR